MEEGQDLAKAWGCPYIETSAKSNINIGEAYNYISRQITRYHGGISDPSISIIGDGGVGKSAINMQYIQGTGGTTISELSFDYFSGGTSGDTKSSAVKGKRNTIWNSVSSIFSRDSKKRTQSVPSIQPAITTVSSNSQPVPPAPAPVSASVSTPSAPTPTLASPVSTQKQVQKKAIAKSPEGLVLLQAASGYWILNDTLATQIGVSCNDLKKGLPLNTTENVWGTVIAIAYLKNALREAEDEWILIVQKAEGWLIKEIGDRVIYDQLYKTAVKFLEDSHVL